MRHINPERVRQKIPKEWQIKAEQALEKIRSLPPEERGDAINKYSHIWTSLKDKLHEVSYGKCWYCETRDVRHDDEIDHLRPKNAVSECPTHPGYWWLAFDWQNFRYGCIYCNQKRKKDKSGKPDKGGKGTSFPLFNEEERIFTECHELELRREKPMLLDPMVRQDTYLLKFDTDGMSYPTKEAPSIAYQRADKSIEVYHLNGNDLVEKRRITVCNEIERLLKEGDAYYYTIEHTPDNLTAHLGYESVINKISLMLDEQSEYSAAAKSVLYINRKKYPWIIEMFDYMDEAS